MVITRTQQSFDTDMQKRRETMPYSMLLFQLINAFLLYTRLTQQLQLL